MAKQQLSPPENKARTVMRTVRAPRKRYIALSYGPKGGSPTYSLKPAAYALVERLSREGLDLASIAAALGISVTAFKELRKRDEAAVEALDRGRAALGDELTDILLAMARKGNVTAAIWLDKTRRGVREDQPIDGARPTPDKAPVININFPPTMEREEYLRLVSGGGMPVTGKPPLIEHEEPTDDG
jgi:hypothetical protein